MDSAGVEKSRSMAQPISSAEPEKLFHYSDFGMQLDRDLVSEACRLAASLQSFEATCTEPGFQVRVSHLADSVRSYGSQNESVDSWVRQVGTAFQRADSMCLTTNYPGQAVDSMLRTGQYANSNATVAPPTPVPMPVPAMGNKANVTFAPLLDWSGTTILPGGASLALGSIVAGQNQKYIKPGDVEFDADLFSLGREHKYWPNRVGRPPESEPKLRMPVWKDEVWDREKTDHTHLGGVRMGGKAEAKALGGEAGVGVDFEKGKAEIGAFAAGTLVTAGTSGVIGSTDLGLAGGVDVTAGEAEAFVGLHSGTVGAKVGGTIASVEGTIGVDVAGWNVGATGEIGLKFELGLEVGKKSRVYLGPVTIGLNIGEALGS